MRKTRNWNTCHGYCIVPQALPAQTESHKHTHAHTRTPTITHTHTHTYSEWEKSPHSWIWYRCKLATRRWLAVRVHSFVLAFIYALTHAFIYSNVRLTHSSSPSPTSLLSLSPLIDSQLSSYDNLDFTFKFYLLLLARILTNLYTFWLHSAHTAHPPLLLSSLLSLPMAGHRAELIMQCSSCVRLLGGGREEIELCALLHNLFSFNKRRAVQCWFLHVKLWAWPSRWRD